MPALGGNGWEEHKGKIILVWFLTSQWPPCLFRESNRMEDSYNVDSEENDDRRKVGSLKHFQTFRFISTLFQYMIFNI